MRSKGEIVKEIKYLNKDFDNEDTSYEGGYIDGQIRALRWVLEKSDDGN